MNGFYRKFGYFSLKSFMNLEYYSDQEYPYRLGKRDDLEVAKF
jgi:hypothetical protein